MSQSLIRQNMVKVIIYYRTMIILLGVNYFESLSMRIYTQHNIIRICGSKIAYAIACNCFVYFSIQFCQNQNMSTFSGAEN